MPLACKNATGYSAPRLQLASATTLQQVALAVSGDEALRGHPRFDPLKPAYRMSVLNALLMSNPKLCYLDELLITPAERVEAMQNSGADPGL